MRILTALESRPLGFSTPRSLSASYAYKLIIERADDMDNLIVLLVEGKNFENFGRYHWVSRLTKAAIDTSPS